MTFTHAVTRPVPDALGGGEVEMTFLVHADFTPGRPARLDCPPQSAEVDIQSVAVEHATLADGAGVVLFDLHGATRDERTRLAALLARVGIDPTPQHVPTCGSRYPGCHAPECEWRALEDACEETWISEAEAHADDAADRRADELRGRLMTTD